MHRALSTATAGGPVDDRPAIAGLTAGTAGYDPAMASLNGLGIPRRSARSSASFGLVTELVKREVGDGPDRPDEEQSPRAPMGVIRIGERTTVCRVEHVPAVGDLIHGDVTGVVEKVQIARSGRVSIFASPVYAAEP